MNWLAHLVLSDPSPQSRVANILTDLLPITDLRQLPASYHDGIARHRQIDAFTDKHPLFRQSIARLDPRYRRFGGVIMDIFYDHLLTARWPDHKVVGNVVDIGTFVDRFYADVELCRTDIPAGAYTILRRMRTGEWLTSYGDVSGVRITLTRMSRRLRRPFDLGSAADELDRNYDPLGQDFDAFFPQIRAQFRAAGPA